jgi:hypothetical protein
MRAQPSRINFKNRCCLFIDVVKFTWQLAMPDLCIGIAVDNKSRRHVGAASIDTKKLALIIEGPVLSNCFQDQKYLS